MKLLKAAQMKEIDKRASNEYMIPSIVLMENAGLRAVEMIESLTEDLNGCKVIILAGRGNNGGDGLVIARHLLNEGAQVECFLLGNPQDLTPDATINYRILEKMNGCIYPLCSDRDLERFTLSLLSARIVVDAIYGIGFRGSLNAFESRIAVLVGLSQARVVAVDIPSGVEADTGAVHGEAIRADYTVTFAAPKVGMIIEPGRDYIGTLTVADITIPQVLLEEDIYNINVLQETTVKHHFRPRLAESHKGTYGHVLVIGGSPGMSGAPSMAAWAALRSGAGLVTTAVPESLLLSVDAAVPEIMSKGLAQTDKGTISINAGPVIADLLRKANVACIGPGMSLYSEGNSVLRWVLEQDAIPLLIDADGLNALQGDPAIIKDRQQSIILTPHPGEMSRLTGLSVGEIQKNRLDISLHYAREWGVTIVLKGNHTVVSTPKGQLFVNMNGNPGMATAGSGDVLSGIISGLTAQGLNADEAALAGVYLHARAGDQAASLKGERALTATDIIHALPTVLSNLEKAER